MRVFGKGILSFVCVLVTVSAVRSESWRVIVPLRSTKSDVERRLGKPSEATDKLLTYRLENETVFISLITEETLGIDLKMLRPGTVRDIQVTPKSTLHVADLGFDAKRAVFIKSSKPGYQGFFGYVDEEAGLIIDTGGSTEIRSIIYFANAKDRARWCPKCSVDPLSVAEVPTCVLCPTVNVTCPLVIMVGESTIFAANVTSGLRQPKETFNWTVTSGKIVSGQGTPTITVDTSDVKSETITATVEVKEIDPACNRTASCSTPVTKRSTGQPKN